MNLENDIDPGASYMDRERCFSIYFYTSEDCFDCAKLKDCEKQNNRDYPPKKKLTTILESDLIRLLCICKDATEGIESEYGPDKYTKEHLNFIKKLKEKI